MANQAGLWLGSANNEVSVCVAWSTSGVTKLEDLYSRQMTVGGTGGGSDNDVFPQVARPRGMLGRLGGRVMARTNAACGVLVCGLSRIAAHDEVLEVGFGPGVIIAHLSALAHAGRVVGIDASSEMVEQARERNIAAISSGRVDLRLASVDQLPLGDNSFDKALAINSMQAWPDAVAGLREIRRVLKPGASIALGFTPYSGQAKEELPGLLLAAGFTRPSLVEEKGRIFCALAAKPDPA